MGEIVVEQDVVSIDDLVTDLTILVTWEDFKHHSCWSGIVDEFEHLALFVKLCSLFAYVKKRTTVKMLKLYFVSIEHHFSLSDSYKSLIEFLFLFHTDT